MQKHALNMHNLSLIHIFSFENAEKMSRCGADVFVAGTSSLYAKGASLAQNYEKLRQAIAAGKGRTV